MGEGRPNFRFTFLSLVVCPCTGQGAARWVARCGVWARVRGVRPLCVRCLRPALLRLCACPSRERVFTDLWANTHSPLHHLVVEGPMGGRHEISNGQRLRAPRAEVTCARERERTGQCQNEQNSGEDVGGREGGVSRADRKGRREARRRRRPRHHAEGLPRQMGGREHVALERRWRGAARLPELATTLDVGAAEPFEVERRISMGVSAEAEDIRELVRVREVDAAVG